MQAGLRSPASLDSCAGVQVAGLEELFSALKADVEALFMQAPTVHLEALATQLHAMEPHLEELVTLQTPWRSGHRNLAAPSPVPPPPLRRRTPAVAPYSAFRDKG